MNTNFPPDDVPVFYPIPPPSNQLLQYMQQYIQWNEKLLADYYAHNPRTKKFEREDPNVVVLEA